MTDELSDDMKRIIGKPQFKQNITFAYVPQQNLFTFFAPTQRGRSMEPIGVFSPLNRVGIPYDPEDICEQISEAMSRYSRHEEYEIERYSEDD